ncbi:hypothetical protein [Kutzneria sp. 744]|uniref:hypothetical protein n=1 Tax=Kutzneria sp. (strain 744) TaxID=345341 RepID=UPI0012F9FE4C|nr:hypothetical protein [Kutzneria sp. 744]
MTVAVPNQRTAIAASTGGSSIARTRPTRTPPMRSTAISGRCSEKSPPTRIASRPA